MDLRFLGEVKPETITNYFRKSSFKVGQTDTVNEEANDSSNESQSDLQEIGSYLNQFPDSISPEEYVTVDNDLPTTETETEFWEQDFFKTLQLSEEETDEEVSNENQNFGKTGNDNEV